MWHKPVLAAVGYSLTLLLLTGCDDGPPARSPITTRPPVTARPGAQVAAKPKVEPVAAPKKDEFNFSKEVSAIERPLDTASPRFDDNRPGARGNMPQVPAVNRLAVEVRDALKVRNTLVIWVLDRTSGPEVRSDATNATELFYRDAGRPVGDKRPNTLYTAVVMYADKPEFLTKEPVSSEADARTALAGVTPTTGAANTFSAVKQAVDEYSALRGKLQCQTIMVLVSTKGGDDLGKDNVNVDAAVNALKKDDIPLFALGASTPFSQAAATGLKGQVTESHDWERIDMAYPGNGSDSDLTDTGFPPFAIGRLCNNSGGQFFAERPMVGSMPVQVDSSYFHKYAPDYVSEEKYRQILSGNRAKAALVRAAREGGHVDVLNMRTSYNFFKNGSEADFNKAITNNQQDSARIDGPINRLLQMLQAGESDRKNIKEPRWQANFDLAIGRAYAAKARVEGLDDIMATLKGKAFKNADSKQWLIMAAPTTSSISAVDNMVKKAHMYLERVVKEHPNTPWAISAERELGRKGFDKIEQYNLGWELSEK
ncbi:MAG TPA: hypothetical protein VFE24_01055 [Pirellulales bacterium]|jgi:hypothetical protein|nr:hypothetical protein [Pirellulales bacterium]